MSRASSADAAMEAAIDWMVALRAGPIDAQLQADFDAWCAASSAHRAAWQKLEQRLATPLQALRQWDQGAAPGQSLRGQLEQPSKRVTLRGLAALGMGLGGAAWVSDRFVPLRYLSADLYSGTGKRLTTTLADGSSLVLNARSAADVYPDRQPPQIDLLQGDLYWAAGPAHAQWCIATRDAHCYSQGALTVRQLAHGSLVLANRGTARLQLAQPPTALQAFALPEGRAALVQDGHIRLAAQWDATLSTWQQGYLLAAPLPLSEVVEQLQRYAPGLLHVGSAAGVLQVHARLPLDDVPRALQALEETLPIQIRRLGGLVTRIDLA